MGGFNGEARIFHKMMETGLSREYAEKIVAEEMIAEIKQRGEDNKPTKGSLKFWARVQHIEMEEGLPAAEAEKLAAAEMLSEVKRRRESETWTKWTGDLVPPNKAMNNSAPSAPAEPADAEHEKKRGVVEEKKRLIRTILDDIADLDPKFSPDKMPGIKKDFFELCKSLNHERFAFVTLATFDDYLRGICDFGKGHRHSLYYEDILRKMRVKGSKSA